MKTIFMIIGLVLSTSPSIAQGKADSTKHLSFKGVPIDGTLAEYVLKMKNSGFVHKGTKDGMAILEGDFASYKNCTIGVSTLKQQDLVSKIVVIFPHCENWSSLSSNYFNLKELLSEKYGNPSESVEEFQSYEPKNDGSKMTLVKLGNCKYYSTFQTKNGTIQVAIENNSESSCFVKLLYLDKINSESVKKQALDDL